MSSCWKRHLIRLRFTHQFVLLSFVLLIGCSEHQDSTSSPQGIDVSHYQGDIDWQKVSSQKLQFVFIKATQGNQYVDPHYQQNWQQSAQYDLLRGIYHYLDPSIDAVAQAKHFVNISKGQFGDFPPVIDIEAFENEKASKVINVLQEFIMYIEQHVSCKPIIYTSHGFWDQLNNHQFGDYPLWLADYASKPQLPNGWQQWTFWQFESNANIPGIPNQVDKNKYNGTEHQLRQLRCAK